MLGETDQTTDADRFGHGCRSGCGGSRVHAGSGNQPDALVFGATDGAGDAPGTAGIARSDR